jgi:arabinogalactan endo-1,4-beta-galactosidase
MKNYHVDYDIIGLSYYPWWHGKSMDSLQLTINLLETKYNKKLVIAETAYPFTLSWNDRMTNIVGNTSQLIPQFPATETGQEAFLLKLRDIIQNSPAGVGFCYWEPEWVSVKGPQTTVESPWENMAQFDFKNKTLPSLSVYQH